MRAKKNQRSFHPLSYIFHAEVLTHSSAPKETQRPSEGGREGRTDGWIFLLFLALQDWFSSPENWANLNPYSNLYLNHLKPKASSQIIKSVYLSNIDGWASIYFRRRHSYEQHLSEIWTHSLNRDFKKWAFAATLFAVNMKRNFRRLSWHSGLVLFC